MLESTNRQGTRAARILNKVGCFAETALTLGMMATVSLSAQQSAPSATTWTGIVRTAAGQTVAGAKVTVFTTQEKQQTAVTGTDGRFAIEAVAEEPHAVSVELPGLHATTPVAVSVTGARIMLTVSDQNTLSVATQQTGKTS